MVSNILYVHPYLGNIPSLTNIFQRSWNHQLDMCHTTMSYLVVFYSINQLTQCVLWDIAVHVSGAAKPVCPDVESVRWPCWVWVLHKFETFTKYSWFYGCSCMAKFEARRRRLKKKRKRRTQAMLRCVVNWSFMSHRLFLEVWHALQANDI